MKKIKVIQGNFGNGWEDLSEYDIPENEEEAQKVEDIIQHDFSEYQNSGYQASYRIKVRYE